MDTWVVPFVTACLFLGTTPVHTYVNEFVALNEKTRLECFNFIKAYIPSRDVNLTDEWLYRHVDAALIPWYCGEMDPTSPSCFYTPWVRQLSWEMFLNNVLPYASLTEPREQWRRMMFNVVSPLVKNATTLAEAALLINKNLWDLWKPSVPWLFQPPINGSIPIQVVSMAQEASAGDEALSVYAALGVFLVNALRSVGIPARMAGTWEWNTPEGGFHDWVEVWDGSAWSFMSPGSWTPQGLNRTWFFPDPARHQIPGNHNHFIWATSWAPTADGNMPEGLLGDSKYVHVLDVTQKYLDAAEELHAQGLRVRVATGVESFIKGK